MFRNVSKIVERNTKKKKKVNFGYKFHLQHLLDKLLEKKSFKGIQCLTRNC